VTNKQLGHCLVYSKKEKDARVKIMLVSNPSDIPTLLPNKGSGLENNRKLTQRIEALAKQRK